MSGPRPASGSAHDPMIRTSSRSVMADVRPLLELCADRMVFTSSGAVDSDTLFPSDILRALGIDTSPGSDFYTEYSPEV